MTTNDILELRKAGKVEDAYEAARKLYATIKDYESSSVMFLTATDILKRRVDEGRNDEANRIFLALKRLISNTPGQNEWMQATIKRCKTWIQQANNRDANIKHVPEHIKLGKWGEELAAAYLREKGYAILERDWHDCHKDIDIVAQQKDRIVFVEVKTRRNRDFIEPELAVNYNKQKNLRMAINHYVKSHRVNGPWRFDVITIVKRPGEIMPDINHTEDWSLI